MQIVIIEEVPLFRCGIRSTLESMGECLATSATDLSVLAEQLRQYKPDVAVLSGDMTRADPYALVELLRALEPGVGIVILAPTRDEERLFQFTKIGARAYALRSITPELLADMVRRVSLGEYLISGEVLAPPPPPATTLSLARSGRGLGKARWTPPLPSQPSLLSSRELEVLGFIASGNSNKEIARSLGISDQTVKNHITSMLKKLHVNDRTAAVVLALRKGWIQLNSSGRVGSS